MQCPSPRGLRPPSPKLTSGSRRRAERSRRVMNSAFPARARLSGSPRTRRTAQALGPGSPLCPRALCSPARGSRDWRRSAGRDARVRGGRAGARGARAGSSGGALAPPGGRAPSCPLTTCRGVGASAPCPKLALRAHPSRKFSDPPDSLIGRALQSSLHPNPGSR